MIVVTGATGQLGRAIVLSLLEKVAASEVVASTRDPQKAAELGGLGVEVRRGDYTDGESLRRVFEGAGQVLMISSNAAAFGGDPIAQHRAVIEAAREKGVRRIVYTSHMGASDRSHFGPMHTHFATEAMLGESGLAWTSLRNGFYASSVLGLLEQGLETGVIRLPQDGKVSWTSHPDLAAGAAAILLDEGRFEGPTPPLTASEALDLADLAAIASKVLGRPIARETLSDDAMREALAARGLPESVIDLQLGMFRASRAGEFSTVNPTLSQLLGRPTQKVADLLAQRLSA